MTDRKPTGGGGARHPRSLANLKPAPAAPSGNRRTLRHGGYSAALVADVEVEVRELMDALGEVAPVRDGAGGVPPADVPALEIAARALRRYRTVSGWCDLHGRLDDRTGERRPAATLELECERAYWRALDASGLNAQARARLGLVIARSVDIASALSEPDAALRSALLREAGLDVDDDG